MSLWQLNEMQPLGLGLPRWAGDMIYASLVILGWLSWSVLASLGAMLAFFLVISNFEPVVFVSHLDNLTTRYLEATPDRQHLFDSQVLTVFALLIVMLMALRAPGIIVRLRRELQEHPVSPISSTHSDQLSVGTNHISASGNYALNRGIFK